MRIIYYTAAVLYLALALAITATGFNSRGSYCHPIAIADVMLAAGCPKP